MLTPTSPKSTSPTSGEGRPHQVLIADALAYYGEAKAKAGKVHHMLALTLITLGEFFAGKTINDITKDQCKAYVDWRINLGDARGSKQGARRATRRANSSRPPPATT